MPVITISRQYGSGAIKIAQRLCEIMGYAYFDKRLMVQVAAEMDISEEDVVDFSEDTYRMRGFLDRLFGRELIQPEIALGRELGPQALDIDTLNEAKSINLVKETILGAYSRDNVVIVGRGGQAILKEKPGVLHVKLMAPMGARALRVKERENISLNGATEITRNKDNAAADYLSRFYDIDWENPLNYHMILNTGKWELDDTVELIIGAVTHLRVPRQY